MRTTHPFVVCAMASLLGCAQPEAPVQAPEIRQVRPPFDLVCKSRSASAPDLVIHFLLDGNGDVVAQSMNGRELVDFATGTYVNAYFWRNATERYLVR